MLEVEQSSDEVIAMVATTDSAKARRTIPWRGLALIELALAAAAVLLDLFIPALVIVALLAVSLVLRRQGLGAVGLDRLAHPWQAAGQTFLLAAAWSVVGIAVLLPVLEHLTGQRQDVSGFTEVEHNVGLLAALVAASWVFAFVEELAFRGYVLQRIRDLHLGGSGRSALLVA